MNLELWQILANQAFDDEFYAEMIENVAPLAPADTQTPTTQENV